MSGSKRYYPALDGLRGFAAFAVLLYHLKDYFESSSFIQGSFLAVDLFFLMSGFVIATSYERSLLDGSRSFASFTWSRVIRLYPLYIIACCIGFSYFLIKHVTAVPDAPDGLELVTSIPPTLLILPWPTAAEWGFTPYPFAPSAWSLSFELWFNIAYAALVIRLSTRSLIAVAAAAFILLVHQAYTHGTIDMGWGMNTMLGGSARFWFSFSVGIIACRLNVHEMGVSRLPLWAAAPSLMFVFLPHDDVSSGLMWIVFAFPLALVICAGFHGNGLLSSTFQHLGRLSYGIYILHAPIILFETGMFKMLLGESWLNHRVQIGLAIVSTVIIATWIFTYFVDEPLRRGLSRLRQAPKVDVNLSGFAGG